MSELTGQTVPVVMGISLLIKTNQPDEINQILNSMHGGDGFQQELSEKAFNLIFKLTGRAKVRPASSDKWKAPFLSSLMHKILL